ncbi:MAG TPA: hypothetical protein VIH59_34055 [Candidatus Tectomicrobia bacterium]
MGSPSEVVDRSTVKCLLKAPYVWFVNTLADPRSTRIIVPEVVQQYGDIYLHSAMCTGPWQPYGKNYAPNLRCDYDGRAAILWPER